MPQVTPAKLNPNLSDRVIGQIFYSASHFSPFGARCNVMLQTNTGVFLCITGYSLMQSHKV